jgi:uncharacterized repeat protein (TIGR02543 family)
MWGHTMGKRLKLLFVFFVLLLGGCTKTEDQILASAFKKLELPAAVEQSLELPSEIKIDDKIIDITWESSDESIIDLQGRIYRSLVDQDVQLTATLTLGVYHTKKEFSLRVLAYDSNTIALSLYDADQLVEILYLEKGSKLPSITPLEEDYATFLAWCTDEDLEEELDLDTSFNTHTKLYAKWDVMRYEIELHYTGVMQKTLTSYYHAKELPILYQLIDLDEYVTIDSISFLDLELNDRSFNQHKRRYIVYVQTTETSFDVRYYQKVSEQPIFDHIYFPKNRRNDSSYYGLTFNNKLYAVKSIPSQAIYFELGDIALKLNDQIKDIYTVSDLVVVTTEHGDYFLLTDGYGYGPNYQKHRLPDPTTLFQLGDFRYILESSSQLREALIAVHDYGFVDLNKGYRLPFVFILEDETDRISDVITFQNDYYILTENHHVYLISSAFSSPITPYGNITDSLELINGEYVTHIEMISNAVYFLTSTNRLIHYATYDIDDAYLSTRHILESYPLDLEAFERIDLFDGRLMITSHNRILKLQGSMSDGLVLLNGDYLELDMPLEDDEVITDYYPVYPHQLVQPEQVIFKTSSKHLISYDQNDQAYKIYQGILLNPDEEILKVDQLDSEKFDTFILTSSGYRIIKDFINQESMKSTIDLILNRSDLISLIDYSDESFAGITSDGTGYVYDEVTQTKLISTIDSWKQQKMMTYSPLAAIDLSYEPDELNNVFWSLAPMSPMAPGEQALGHTNLYLYPTPFAYRINFDTKISQSLDPMIFTSTDPAVLPELTQHDKVFVGWYHDENFEIDHAHFTYTLGQTYTLHARWEDPTYQIIYHDGDNILFEESFDAGSIPIVDTEQQVKDGYHFRGWFDENGVKYVVKNIPWYNDIHLYASFVPKSYTLEIIDQDDVTYYVNASHFDQLNDLNTSVYGYLITDFYQDHMRTMLYPLDHEITGPITLYVLMEPIDVFVILLGMDQVDYQADFRLIGDLLFAKSQDAIYLYESHKEWTLDNLQTFLTPLPINLSSITEIDELSEILLAKRFGKYVVLVTEENVFMVDTTNQQLVLTFASNLGINESFSSDQIILLSNSKLEHTPYMLVMLTNQNRLYTVSQQHGLSIEIDYTDMIISNNRLLLKKGNKTYWAFLDNNLELELMDLNQEQRLPYPVSLYDRYFSGSSFIEVYEDGLVLEYRWLTMGGTPIINCYEHPSRLESNETILARHDDLLWLSSNRLLPVLDSIIPWEDLDLENMLEEDETIVKVLNDGFNTVLVTSLGKLIHPEVMYQQFTKLQDEKILGVRLGHVVTSKNIYHYDMDQQSWNPLSNPLGEDEHFIDFSHDYVVTSKGRSFSLNLLFLEDDSPIDFILYKILEILEYSFNSQPNIIEDTSYPNIAGWYLDSYKMNIFEKINTLYPIVLYPDYQ